MLGASLIQSIYAVVLNRFPAATDGYSIEGHRFGTGFLILLVMMAMGWYFLSARLPKRLKTADQLNR